MKVIIRVSLTRDTGSKLRNVFNPHLVEASLANTAKGKYEGDIEPDRLAQALDGFWTAVNGYGGPAQLDHFWMYVERATD